MKYTYAAVFTEGKPDERGFTVQFYDVPGAITEGDRMKECVENAEEVLSMMLCTYEDEKIEIPSPTPMENIPLETNQLVKLITADPDDHRAIKKAWEDNPIRYAREQNGMNIKELADFLGAPYRTVQDWNSGKNRPPRWCEKLIVDKIWSK